MATLAKIHQHRPLAHQVPSPFVIVAALFDGSQPTGWEPSISDVMSGFALGLGGNAGGGKPGRKAGARDSPTRLGRGFPHRVAVHAALLFLSRQVAMYRLSDLKLFNWR